MSEQVPHLGAVIVCAGSARRMGGIDKLLTPILGMPAAARSIAIVFFISFPPYSVLWVLTTL